MFATGGSFATGSQALPLKWAPALSRKAVDEGAIFLDDYILKRWLPVLEKNSPEL